MIFETHTRDGIRYSAGFGSGGRDSQYRYTLRREWDPRLYVDIEHGDKHALFIMLNPSTADAFKDDPTVAKCMRLAMRWGFGGVEVRNIFALRSPQPKDLRTVEDPTGGLDNDVAIADAINDPRTGAIIAAWGNHGRYKDRAALVTAMLKASGRPVYAFAVSNQQQPMHPLYQPERELRTPECLMRWL